MRSLRSSRRDVLLGMAASGLVPTRSFASPAPGLSAIEVVARDLRFPEGPIAVADGSLLFVQILGGTIDRLTKDGRVETVATVGAGPNGLARAPDGAIIVAKNGGNPQAKGLGAVQRLDPHTGAVRTLYEGFEGVRFDGPNDCVFDASGGFYFTDFAAGALYWALPDGKALRLLDRDVNGANGVALSPDGTELYVARSPRRIARYRVRGPGRLGRSEEISALDGDFHYDSMKVAASGELLVAAWQGGIKVFTQEGRLKQSWALPGFSVTNLAFGGPDRRTVWMSAVVPNPPTDPAAPHLLPKGVLLRARAPLAGLRLNFA